jgi:2-(1,2-epoxy-1,2-dihydrophenyl)acetyl-CoA isomerase
MNRNTVPAYDMIRLTIAEDVATLTWARPARLNAITEPMFAEASDALKQVVAQGARALVITGEGRAFCAGADLQDEPPADVGQGLEDSFNPFIEQLFALPVPVITAVNGAAAGAGCALALAADIIIAARSAYFLLAFVNIGLVPDVGATWLLPRLVGRARAAELMMLGEKLSAEKAESWGLINRVVADDEVVPQAQALAARFARGPTQAYRLMRATLLAAETQTLSETLRAERLAQREAGATSDFKEGVAAFRERRPARFTGR